jgi:hypothetical protein
VDTKLIRLEDGTLVEVDVPTGEAQQISGGIADNVDKTIDIIKPTLLKICRPLMDTWAELNKDVHLEQAEVELALSFDVEGNLYLAKAKTGASLKVKLVLKP